MNPPQFFEALAEASPPSISSPELHSFCVMAGSTILSIVAINVMKFVSRSNKLFELLVAIMISGVVWRAMLLEAKPEHLSFRTLVATLLHGLMAFVAAYGIQTHLVSTADWVRRHRESDTHSER